MKINNSCRTAGYIVFLVALLSLTGCATMFAQKTAEVKFTAEPADETSVYVDGTKYDTGQLVQLSKKTKTVLFSNPNFGEFAVPLDRKVNGGWIALDIFFTPGYGIIGLAVDGSTAAWYRFPNSVNFDFAHATALQSGQQGSSKTTIPLADRKKADALRNQPPAKKRSS